MSEKLDGADIKKMALPDRLNNAHFVDSNLGQHLSLCRKCSALDHSNIASPQRRCSIAEIFHLHHFTHICIGCSLNILFFSQEFSKVCHLSLARTRCYWLYKKLPANRSDCTLALRALKGSYSDVGVGGVAMNCEKNTNFPEQPVHRMIL